MNAKLSKVNQSIEKTIQIVEVMARGKPYAAAGRC